MATPSNITTLDLSGKWLMNKKLSGDLEPILQHQGIGYLIRKVIGLATVTSIIKHIKDDAGVEHLEVEQVMTGGLKVKETRTLDWTEVYTDDNVFGPIINKARRLKVEEHDIAFLKEGWLPDTMEHGGINAHTTSDTPKNKISWTAEQIWGFEEVEVEPGKKERCHVRHMNFTGPKQENIQIRMVYDYLGPV